MRSGNLRNFVVAALATVATVWATGCAQGVGTVDRTQAHRIDKAWLNDGKPWYFLQTVVDAPPTTNFTFVGESSFPPDRIVWSVQENWLYAYRNYEWIKGSQQPYSSLDHGSAGGSLYYGAPIAAYKITSHFDVQRDYNAATGEQTNVIEENTTDRPWYQRQYMHVDWSNNGLSAFDFLTLGIGGPGTTLNMVPVAYYPDEEDPTNKDRAEVTPNYIGVVNKITYQSELDQEATQQLGFPVFKCYLWTNVGIGDCGPGEVKVRLSFKKIEDDHDFFPRNYTDKDVNLFGVWTQQQAVYDPERGYLTPDFSANQMAVMHHIWQKDHAATDPVTHLACDIHDNSNPNCEMPLNQRNPKPIIYYVSESWPALGDPNHKTMWLQAKLLAEEYNDDMRSVVAAARRGGVPVAADPVLSPVDGSGKPVANFQFQAPDVWAAQNNVALTNTKSISYGANGTINYRSAKGLDFLTYPPDTRQLAFAEGGYDAMLRPNVTLVNDNGDPCTAAQVAAGGCTTCDPTKNYCMGIGHLPYTVVPRMFAMCHNPVQPRIVKQNDVLPDGTTYSGSAGTIDKTDPTKPESYDFSTPGDPGVCDARNDADRKTAPLNPQLGDLRYHMLAWVPQPDISAPGGIGEPAMDPVTGEIVSAHAYIYAHAVEGLATYGADLVAILNGWENVNDYVQGNMVKDYVIATQNRIPPIFSGQKLTNYVASAPVQSKIQNFQYQVSQHLRDPGGPGDVAVGNWKKLTAINDTRLPTGPNEEVLRAFAPDLGLNSSGSQIPAVIQNQFTWANLIAPESVSTWDQADTLRSKLFAERHILDQAEIEPTAVRLAQYYKTQLAPGATTNPCSGDPSSPVYRTCVWEAARQEILGNLWRSYSDHEVGHTFGQFHNFAGSTDALNYFDPYWDIRQENTISVSASAPPNSNGAFMFAHLGTVPATSLPGGKTDTAVLAPEFMQAPTQQSLLEGLREYQYTSIMDYNSKFNADFQGIGKYDHACHMYQYARQVEVFDPDQLSKVPANNDTDTTNVGNGQPTHPHQVADELLIPFNRHYTFYPWLINDGLSSEGPNGKKTPLAQAIAKMIHARKWVSYNDLMNGIQTADQAKVNGFDDPSKFNNSLMVPYRFCSDYYNQGQAHCLWFDEGADPYEQAIGFINAYKLNYFFNNFKHGNEQFAPQGSPYLYLSRLWSRNFLPLVRIFQHALNDEFIVRFDPKYTCLDALSPGGTTHVNAIQCGLDRLATQATIMDFYAKILQTPNAGEYGWVTSPTGNTYCSTESGHCNPGTPSTTNAAHPALTLAPGESSRYDESQWDINKYGHLYMYQPSVMGNWFDKWYAIKAMTDYDSYIIGAENSKPFDYLISLASWYDVDVNNAIGGLFVDDPKWAPKVAYYTSDPGNPDHPPFTLYQNTGALQDIGAANVPNDPWCPTGTGSAPPGLENCPSNLSFSGSFDHDETQLAALGYTVQPLNPGPVYYERTTAIYYSVLYLTSEVDNLQFLRTIKVNMKGSGTFDNTAVQALTCSDGSACTPVAATSCEDGSSCSATKPCTDNSLCLSRQYNCPTTPGVPACNGVCMDPSNPTPETCDPSKYAEFTDRATGNTYFATTYLAGKQAPFGGPATINYYSIGYELVKQAAASARLTPNQPLSSVQLLDILRALYYYWSYDPYFRP